jgi:hypothetical protein
VTPLPIEFLYWDGCPSHPEARARLDAALERAGVEAEIHVREVTSEREAAELGFYGSPTIRVAGRDVEPVAPGTEPSLGCRIYTAPGGRVGPVPSHQVLDRAIEEAS